jgi:hypothetical protein
MERRVQLAIEYTNYGLAVLLLALLAIGSWVRTSLRRRYYAKGLSL